MEFTELEQYEQVGILAIGQLETHNALNNQTLAKSEHYHFLISESLTVVLREIGVPDHHVGYLYLREAIMMAVEDKDITNSVTNVLYSKVALKYSSTPCYVECSIRNAIQIAWDKGNLSILQRYFSCNSREVEGRPTNRKFIAMIAEWLELQGKQYMLIA